MKKGSKMALSRAQWDSLSRTVLKVAGTYLAAKGVDGDTLALLGGVASIALGLAWSWCEHSTRWKICGDTNDDADNSA